MIHGMTWQFFITISILTGAISTLLQKVVMKGKKTDPVAFTIAFQLITAVVIGMYAFFHGFSMPNILSYLPNFIAMMLLYGFGNIFIFSSLRTIDASEFTIIYVLRWLWTVLVAVSLFHESFLFLQMIGTLLVLTSVILVSSKKSGIHVTKGTLYALAASVCFGLAFANDTYLVRHFDVASYQFISFLSTGILLLLIYSFTWKKMMSFFTRKTLPTISLLAVIYSISAVTMLLAYKASSHTAEIAALGQTTTIVTVIFSIIFLKETRGLLKKSISVLLAFIGVLLIH